jgi:hypothetical protein
MPNKKNNRIIVSDIFVPKKIKVLAKEIVGIKKYRSVKIKFFALGWRALVAIFFVSYFGFGFSPYFLFYKTINAFTARDGKVELYANTCSTENTKTDMNSGWWNEAKATGRPSVARVGEIMLFSDENSAFYQGGRFGLECSEFGMINYAIKHDGKKNDDERITNYELRITNDSEVLGQNSKDRKEDASSRKAFRESK